MCLELLTVESMLFEGPWRLGKTASVYGEVPVMIQARQDRRPSPEPAS